MADGSTCDKSYDGTATTVVVVLGWFVLNVSLGSLTKWTFLYGEICTTSGICRPYKFPLAMTVVHMLFSWAFCGLYFSFFGAAPATEPLNWKQQFSKIVPLATWFSGSVALGNLSLKYIYPSFNQMLASMTPIITVLISVACVGKRYKIWTWISLPIICGGLLICSMKEVNFHAFGVCCATGATVARAVKSIIQGKLLVDPSEKLDAVTLLFYMAPYSAGMIFFASLVSEGVEPYLVSGTGPRAYNLILLLALGGMNACFMNILNFLVTAYTSAVMLQILGNVKNCFGIMISVLIFGNALVPIQALGVVLCLGGVWFEKTYGGEIKEARHQSDSAITAVELDMQSNTAR